MGSVMANIQRTMPAPSMAHTFGAGRVFCFTPGHRDEVLADCTYRQFLVRGIQWALGRL